MNAQQLRAAILQRAIEGKIVPQLDSEPAVEQIGDAPEDVPFALPEKWKWVSLGSLGNTQTGSTPPTNHREYFGNEGDIPFIKPGDISNNRITYRLDGLSDAARGIARLLAPESVLMVCIGGSIGKTAITDREVSFNQQINAITCSSRIDPHYLHSVFSSRFFQKEVRGRATGTATPIINKNTWAKILVPLPPIDEQRRIVAKLEELLPLVEEYGKSQEALDKLNSEIGDKLRASILQEAIQGKLVPQIDSEPAVEQIGDAPEDVPFAIPEKWKWEQADYLQTLVRGITFPASAKQIVLTESGIRCLTTGSVQKNYRATSDVFVNKSFVKNAKQLLKKGDIVISSANSRELVGKSILWVGEDEDQISFGGFLTVARTQDGAILSPEFLYLIYQYLFISGFFANLSTQTTNIANISNKLLNGLAFPLPPLEEQRRIVARVEALLKEVDAIAR